MFKKFFDFISEAKLELKKVAWTPVSELMSSTWVVVVSVIVITLYVTLIGMVLELVVKGLFKLVSS